MKYSAFTVLVTPCAGIPLGNVLCSIVLLRTMPPCTCCVYSVLGVCCSGGVISLFGMLLLCHHGDACRQVTFSICTGLSGLNFHVALCEHVLFGHGE